MEKEEYGIAEKKVDPWIVIILIFLGWLGIDKFYYAKSFKKAWKFALVKLAYTVVGIGIFWNIYDIIKACMDKYEFDFRDYFR